MAKASRGAPADVADGDTTLMAHRVANHLREAIFEGRIKAGSPIRQEAVAAELGVSRIPVREALLHLEGEGLVTTRPHSGARVAFLDYEDCLALYKIRERLDPLGISESIPHLTQDDLAELDDLAIKMEGLSHDYVSWMAIDRQFHLASYRGAHPRIQSAIESYWNSTQQYRRPLVQSFEPDRFAQFNAEHRFILDALKAGDGALAEQAIRGHIARARERLTHLRGVFDT